MNAIGERIRQLRSQLGISQSQLAEDIGESKQTLYKYETGIVTNIPLQKLEAIARVLDCPPAALVGWETAAGSAPAEREIDRIFDTLNPDGQSDLLRYGRYLTGLESFRRPEEAPVIDLIADYLTPAAAGYASPIEGEEYRMIPRPDDAPPSADFCLRVSGDSMEPYIHDGQRVYVKRGAALSPFDVGIFFVAGDVYCKQYCPGFEGQLYLLSANPQRQDANILLTYADSRGVVCFGKVLLPKKLPKPSYL